MPPPVQLQATAAKLIDPNGAAGLGSYNVLTAVVSGPEANILAGFCNMVVQWIKGFEWFDQNVWSIPLLLVLGLGTGLLLWHDDLNRALMGGLNISAQSWVNFAALKDGPIMPPAASIGPATMIERG